MGYTPALYVGLEVFIISDFKIESKFYVIMGDNNPIYVGYTNRTVGQRFKEHLRGKDFSNYSAVRVVELNRYEKDFNFTWDYFIIQKDAEIVDNTERYLISKYGTQNSIYQKEKDGRQNWAEIKHFVLANKNNPKFKEMTSDNVKKYLETEQTVYVVLETFVSHMLASEITFLQSFVGSMQVKEIVSIKSFAYGMNPKEFISLTSFVYNMSFKEFGSLKSFVGSMQFPEIYFLKNFTGSMRIKEVVSLETFVSHMLASEITFLQNFVGSMQVKEIVSIESFVGNMKGRNRE